MTGTIFAGILRVLYWIASTTPASCCGLVAITVALWMGSSSVLGQDLPTDPVNPKPAVGKHAVGKHAAGNSSSKSIAETDQSHAAAATKVQAREELIDLRYEFGPEMGQIRQLPSGWKRQRGINYKTYVKIGMVRYNRGSAELERLVRWLDGQLIYGWQWAKDQAAWNPHLNLLNHHLAISWSLLANQIQKDLKDLPPSPADALFGRYLRVDLNGSGAMVTSPDLNANASHQYRFG